MKPAGGQVVHTGVFPLTDNLERVHLAAAGWAKKGGTTVKQTRPFLQGGFFYCRPQGQDEVKDG